MVKENFQDPRLHQVGGGYASFGPLNKTLGTRFKMRLRQYLGDQARAEGHDVNWYRNHPDPRYRSRVVNNFFKDPKLQENIFGTARFEGESLPDWHARMPEALGPALHMEDEDRHRLYKQFQDTGVAYSHPQGQGFSQAPLPALGNGLGYRVLDFNNPPQPHAGVIPLHLRLG